MNPLGRDLPWPAPAKLNLCLHIVGRRADGYHLLQSAMQFIDLCDHIHFWKRPPGVIERVAGPINVPADADLVIKAARLLSGVAGSGFGVAIELRKHIPMQAGLGGGSSDAATVLVGLNRLWKVGLSVDALAELGAKLGADVPIFVRGQAAWVEGVGELITPTEYPESVFLVIKPAANISTAEIFSAPELTRNTPITTIRALRNADGQIGGHNDCTITVRNRYPEVAEALDWLGQFAPARLTGTGACVFAMMPNRRDAERICERVPQKWQGYVAQGLNRSPLLARLEAEDDEDDA